MASWRKGVGGGDGGLDVEQGMGKKGGMRWKIKEGFWGWGYADGYGLYEMAMEVDGL